MTETAKIPPSDNVGPGIGQETNAAPTKDAGAASDVMPHTRWQKARLVGLVILKRVRFIAVLAAVGLFIGYWDTVMNYWDKWTHPRGVASREIEAGHEFYCPMDPQVIRSTYEPNGDVPKCPICGMPLSKRVKGESAKLPEGITGRVQLSPERIQLAGIRTAVVGYRKAFDQIRTVGYVTFDESRLSRIVSRVDGYVEKLYLDKTFTLVHKGDPLAEIYSPEMYSTARELRLSVQEGHSGTMVQSAKNRLLLWGVSEKEIDDIISAEQPSYRLMIRSPQEGYVIDRKIVLGSSVDAKMTLFEVADLSSVWVEAEVYERDIPFLRVGQKIEATVEAYPYRVFTGHIDAIYPQVEVATRTNRVRLKVDNPEHALRPGMFASVRINTPLESIEPFTSLAAKVGRVVLASNSSQNAPAQYEFLSVPERAVIDTGAKKIVYVEREPGVFEGVEIEIGPRHDDYYPVTRGLKAGDKVAAAGSFLIDAETRLNPAAAATYFGASGGPQTRGSSPAPAVSPEKPETGPSKVRPEPRVAIVSPNPEDVKNIEQLPEADWKPALTQRICPVTRLALGSMGVPVKITLQGQPVFLCCKGCMGRAKQNPEDMLKILADAHATVQH